MNYFATPIRIGCGSRNAPEFPTPESLLKHLDYLGIDRALVCSESALSYSVTNGNQRLIEAVKPYRDRLLPALVLTPSGCYEYGTLEWLRSQAKAGQRAFFISPAQSGFRARELERILAELAEYSPVIFMDRDNDAVRDIDYLAERFPLAFFVIGKAMWGNFPPLLDLMWRRKNVGVDISWLHMLDAMELVAEQFGAERLFFGIGHTSQYGAAIGALVHAQLPESSREAIAHGNLEKLLGIAPRSGKLAHEPEFSDQLLWKNFKSGKALAGVEVCDAHTHLSVGGWVSRETDPVKMLDRMVKTMDRHGVTKLGLIDGDRIFSDDLLESKRLFVRAARKYDRFWGYFSYNPNYADQMGEAALDEFFLDDDFYVGFKMLGSYWNAPYDDARYRGAWEYAEKHHLPILLHTWDRDAEPLEEIAPRYPHAKFILGHTGGSDLGRKVSTELAEKFPNIYLEFCGTFCSTIPWYKLLEKFDRSRLIFGSDFGVHNEAFELGGFLSQPLPDAELLPILGENFKKILADRQ